MNSRWEWELRASRARRGRRAFDELKAQAGPHLEVENHMLNHLMFGLLAKRARTAVADAKRLRTGRRTLLRVNTEARTVLTASGEPAPISYDRLTKLILARESRRPLLTSAELMATRATAQAILISQAYLP